jgi:hypothetical protein
LLLDNHVRPSGLPYECVEHGLILLLDRFRVGLRGLDVLGHGDKLGFKHLPKDKEGEESDDDSACLTDCLFVDEGGKAHDTPRRRKLLRATDATKGANEIMTVVVSLDGEMDATMDLEPAGVTAPLLSKIAEVEAAADGLSVDPLPAETVPCERLKRIVQELSATVTTDVLNEVVPALALSFCASGIPVCLQPV